MYIVTFYSFKGGVGRTMAMVNIGFELVQRGRNVLLVDFDLEAPGIDTFNLPRPKTPSLGLVDFVTDYQKSRKSPNISKYLYKSLHPKGGAGTLWIMPSGKQDTFYSQKLSRINWQNLYENEDGYLLMDDMKEQWKKTLQPDYVLIDSRTGHSDVSGICTRQLPDAVVMLFFPNDQNLFGLQKVVPRIREEVKSSKKERIHLHFVTGNVPDLDDENQILEDRLKKFKKTLKYSDSLVIHHYNNLALLNQEIFTDTHPRSRLAHEYRSLVKDIIRQNNEDREGVLDSFLNSDKLSEERAVKIEEKHNQDGEILAELAEFRMRHGRDDEALELINQSIKYGYDDPNLLLERASISWPENQKGALKDLKTALNSNRLESAGVTRAVNLLRKINPNSLSMLSTSKALKALDVEDQVWIAKSLSRDRKSLQTAEDILLDLLKNKKSSRFADISHELGLVYIGLGKFKESMNQYGSIREDIEAHGIADVFNYACAEWGDTKIPPLDLFQRVITLSNKEKTRNNSPNYPQCMSIAHWAVGNIEEAELFLKKAKETTISHPRFDFSSWRFHTVSPITFIDDLKSIRKMIEGKKITPKFITT